MENNRCTIWEEECKINFNFFDNSDNKTKQLSKDEFYAFLDKELPNLKGKVVVNGGHFIPSLTNPEKIGKNSIETWKSACFLAKWFLNKGIESYVSLIINDLPFTPEERKKISLKLPNQFKELAEEIGVKIMNPSENSPEQYSEKKLANKFSSQSKSKRWDLYGGEITNLCAQAIIAYSRDIYKKELGVSIWITPKCSHKTLIETIKVFNDKENNLRTLIYFQTDNCFI